MRSLLGRVKPRNIVYLYSGGKDSSLALLLTRDVVREYSRVHKVKTYIVHVVIPGNSHPLNTYCSSTVMMWHKKHYNFEPVWLTSSKVFQEYVKRFGLQFGSQRWCYTEFKWKPIVGFLRRLQRPILVVDGMSPHDSERRAREVTAELMRVESGTLAWWSWHPLYNVKLSKNEKLKMLEEHEEFRCIVELYRAYGDSLNCIVCPYRVAAVELGHIVAEYINNVVKSDTIKKRLSRLRNKPLSGWMNIDPLTF